MAVNKIVSIFAAESKKGMKGTQNVPFLIFSMESKALIELVNNQLQAILAEQPTIFLVNIKVKPTNNIKIFLDADDGLSIEKCIRINRQLYKIMEELAIFPEGDFSLEVSSPGIDEPLLLTRQYHKNIGRTVEVIWKDGTQKTGKLITVAEADFVLETTTGKGKKAETQQIVVPFEMVKTTTVQIQF